MTGKLGSLNAAMRPVMQSAFARRNQASQLRPRHARVSGSAPLRPKTPGETPLELAANLREPVTRGVLPRHTQTLLEAARRCRQAWPIHTGLRRMAEDLVHQRDLTTRQENNEESRAAQILDKV